MVSFSFWLTYASLVAQSRPILCDTMDCNPPGCSVHGESPGKNTGMDCHALLQGICPTQGLNPGLLHCRWILYCLSQQESPRILEWVTYPFCRGISWPRNQTGASCIAGGFFTSWTTREAWLTMIISSCIHVAANGNISFFFRPSRISLYTCTTSSLSTHLLTDI